MAEKTKRRGQEILHTLLHRGTTSVEELTGQFNTSTASVRRDLLKLEKQGLVHRTRGGAVLAGQTYEPFRFDASFPERAGRFQREKQLIAQRVAAIVQDGDTIGITSGTTTTLAARALQGKVQLRVLTNAVNIALELAKTVGLEVTLTGGRLLWPGAFSLTGPTAVEAAEGMLFDRILLGVTGIDVEHGATIIEPEEAGTSRAFVRQAREVIVVADSSKIGMTSRAVICGVQRVAVLVTDSGIEKSALAAFQCRGVRVLIAE